MISKHYFLTEIRGRQFHHYHHNERNRSGYKTVKNSHFFFNITETRKLKISQTKYNDRLDTVEIIRVHVISVKLVLKQPSLRCSIRITAGKWR